MRKSRSRNLSVFLFLLGLSNCDSGGSYAPPPVPLPIAHPEADRTNFNFKQLSNQITQDPQLQAWAAAAVAIDQAFNVLSDTPSANLLSNPPDPQPGLMVTQARDAYRHAESFNFPSLNIRSSCNGSPSEVSGTIQLNEGVKIAYGQNSYYTAYLDGYSCGFYTGAVSQFISSRGVIMGAPTANQTTGQTTVAFQGSFLDIISGDNISVQNLMIEIQRIPTQ